MESNTRSPSLITKAFAFYGGWLILGIIVGLSVWQGHAGWGLAIIGGLGLAASLIAFPTFHMPAAMLVVLAWSAFRVYHTPWGIVLPWLVSGYMVSVWIEDMVLGFGDEES